MPGTSQMSQGAWSWVADFTGPGIIMCWGGGESGASGISLARGGEGGEAGYLCVDQQDFVTGQTYTGYNGAGGATVPWAGGGGHPSNPGETSYFGGGTSCRAPGGASGDIPQGRAKIPGGAGINPPGGDWSGGRGGDAPTQGAYAGGQGGATGNQGAGNPGQVPGGGGAGGGQSSSGDGAAGANGGCVIIPAPDSTQPGYFLIGLDESYNFSAVGTYDDYVATGNGFAMFEAVGSGGGGRGGNGIGLQGAHGGSGGAWAAELRPVFKDVSYRRVVPAGGAGTALNGGAAANGADASWNLTPLRVIQKGLTSNVATIWTCAPGSSTPQKHGLQVGETTVVSGVDATFNGTVVVTAVAADRLSFSYAKTASNVTPVAVTPTGTVAGALANPFVLAKGGLGATGTYTGGTPQPGGDAAACIGTYKASGGRGSAVRSSTSTAGGDGGSGALPLGEQGGWGGNYVLAAGNAGDPGQVPGGAGGGGAGKSGGNGGDGARGAAIVRWVLELNGIWVGGERKSVTRVKIWTGSPGSEVGHTVVKSTIWDTGVANSPMRTMQHPESLKRRYPAYLPSNYKGYFDRTTGTFNWKQGVGTKILDAMNAGDLDFIVFGDSVSEGWTSFDGLITGTKDFPKAFPRIARDYLSGLVSGLAKGGTGIIRPNTVSGVDPQWDTGSWSTSGDKHYVTSSTTSHVATLTPGLDSAGVQITGNKVAVVYSGGGIVVKDSGGTTIGTGAATGSNATLARLEITMGSTAGHVVKVSPSTTTQVCLFGAGVYKTGIRVHNLSQGGTKAGGGTGQDYWGPATGMTAPSNMTATYTQGKFVSTTKTQPECYLIFLGGNDSNAGSDAATIKAATKRIVDMIQAAAPNAAIVLMPDVWTSDRNLALLDLCREEGVAMIDFFYLSRALTEIFGQNYNGDPFGHLNSTTGAQWAAGMVRDAFLYDPS